ncbi:MAG TPA: ABC transporter permease, partial [Thermoanaerobaculia bacterium]|nr:ABC transporter permease [Thermoanaerobaculia bacterium]
TSSQPSTIPSPVAVRFRSGHHHRTGALSGIPADARLGRLVSRTGEVIGLPPDGLVLSQRLAELLEVEPGSTVRVEVLEGKRPMREVRVSRVIDDMLGLNASLEIGALNRLLGEGPVVSGALLELDPGAREALDRQLKQTPAVAGTTFLDAALKAFRKTLAEHLWITLTTIVGFAGVIAFGVVYNTARVSLSERSRELASLRVLGFTRAEISVVLLGELALVVLASLPLGCLWGWWLAVGTMQLFGTDLYRMPLVPNLSTMATAALVVLGAALASALVVRHRLDHLDLVAVLKISE